MRLDFTTNGVVRVSMIGYINDVIKEWKGVTSKLDNGFEQVSRRQRIATAAPDHLFKVNVDQVKLGTMGAKDFHKIVAMMLYVTKRAWPDTALSIAFLTTRVRGPDEDDWRKLEHLIDYLQRTHELPLTLGATKTGVLHW